jgi:hypothetical protein
VLTREELELLQAEGVVKELYLQVREHQEVY